MKQDLAEELCRAVGEFRVVLGHDFFRHGTGGNHKTGDGSHAQVHELPVLERQFAERFVWQGAQAE